MSIKYEFNKKSPLSITCTGRNYEVSKKLSMGDVFLFVERDLSALENENYGLGISFSIKLIKESVSKRPKIEVLVTSKKMSSYLLLKQEIEEVLWSYNKQVLIEDGGQFYTLFSRFEYLIKFVSKDANVLKKVI